MQRHIFKNCKQKTNHFNAYSVEEVLKIG